MIKRIPRTDTLIGLALALVAFAVYLLTLSRSIGPEDAGELAASAYTLGVSHPTGYPLFSLLGRAFTMLPLGDLRVIVKLNLMGAVLCAAGVFVAYRLFVALLRPGMLAPPSTPTSFIHKNARREAVQKRSATDNTTPSLLSAAVGALVLAFSRVVWTNAVIVEVYALHLLLLCLATWAFIAALDAHRRVREGLMTPGSAFAESRWQLFAYVLGLSFANHMMTVLLAPAFLWLYFSTHGAGRDAWFKIARAVPVFALALSSYLYLPLRAMTAPPMNWGDVTVWSRFLDHVTGEQYRDRMFSSSAIAWSKAGEFFRELPADFGYLPLLFIVIGLVAAWRSQRRLFIFTSLIFITGVFYAINYDFEDANFRLNAHVMAALWAGLGFGTVATSLATITTRLPGRITKLLPAAMLGVAVVAFPLAANYSTMDESENYAVEDFVRSGLTSLEPNAVIVSGTFIEFSFVAWYLQYVEGVRPDVLVADYSLLGLAWHFLDVERARPALSAQARQRMVTFMRGRPPRSANTKRLPPTARIDPHHVALISAFLQTWHGLAPLYLVGLVPDETLGYFYDVPEGLVRRLYLSLPPAEAPLIHSIRPLPDKDTRHVHNVRGAFAEAYYNQGLYRLVVHSDSAGAATLARAALALRPEFDDARDLLTRIRSQDVQGPRP